MVPSPMANDELEDRWRRTCWYVVHASFHLQPTMLSSSGMAVSNKPRSSRSDRLPSGPPIKLPGDQIQT